MNDYRTWPRSTRIGAALFLIVIGGWFLFLVQAMLGPLMLAGLLAFGLHPLVDLTLARTRLNRHGAALLVSLLFVALLALAGVVIIPPLVAQSTLLAAELAAIAGTLAAQVAENPIVLGREIPLDELQLNFGDAAVQTLQIDRLVTILLTTSENALWLVFVLVTMFYLLRDWDRLREWFFLQAPPAAETDIRRLYHAVSYVWSAYLRGQFVLMFTIGVLTSLSMVAVGLPGGVALGIVAGVLDIIPSIGPAVAMIIAAVVALFEGSLFLPLSNVWFALLVVAVFALIQTVENVWLRPRIMGERVQLHPALVFVAIIISLTLYGILLTLLIVPLLGTARVLGRYVWARLLDLDPWPVTTPVVTTPAAATVKEQSG